MHAEVVSGLASQPDGALLQILSGGLPRGIFDIGATPETQFREHIES
jgi:hypothetical protein